MIKVYVKVNENNEIIDVNSSIFLKDTTDYILIDEGQGDKYAHAQSQYLDGGLIDRYGRYNYRLVDNNIEFINEEEKPVVETVKRPAIEERLASIELDLNVLLGMEE